MSAGAEKVGVVGAGLMGAEIALVFALAGHDVLLSDRGEAELKTALERLGTARETRPLLDRPDPLGELSALMAKRVATYRTADMIIDTELIDTQQVIKMVVAAATGL